MSEAAVTLDTVLCKVAGCTEEATSIRGRYAKLCARHRASAANEGAAELMTTPRPDSTAPVESYESRARLAAPMLIAAGRDIDKALTQLDRAKAKRNVAVHEWNRALRILSGKPVDAEPEPSE